MVPYVQLSTNYGPNNFITIKNIFSLHQKPIPQMVDSCTYNIIFFPRIKSSLALIIKFLLMDMFKQDKFKDIFKVFSGFCEIAFHEKCQNLFDKWSGWCRQIWQDS